MTTFRTIAAAALAGLTAFGVTASASLATQTIEEGSGAAHFELLKTVQDHGVKVLINDPYCGKKEGIMGFYQGTLRVLVICQENGVPGGPMVGWTKEDLDTLRHESQHFIQDCVVGTNHDHKLAPLYNSPTELALEELGAENTRRIMEAYRKEGATDLTLLLEYEAFAVASMNIPAEQAQDIKTYCGGN
tara:strand:- start:29 stop:595 length:567 start_codon:yes stop_codon:yes gene_type:complete